PAPLLGPSPCGAAAPSARDHAPRHAHVSGAVLSPTTGISVGHTAQVASKHQALAAEPGPRPRPPRRRRLPLPVLGRSRRPWLWAWCGGVACGGLAGGPAGARAGAV